LGAMMVGDVWGVGEDGTTGGGRVVVRGRGRFSGGRSA
jgi:hypothetical protein